ncbi:MAG: hypothetical protein WCI02_00040 [Planctomycetota bacterium]
MKFELPWDPEIESPATIAILGGGPIGIEAAIYARFLGYFVSIFEARRVGHRMLDWFERPLDLPSGEITSSLGHAAIKAQNPEYQRIDPHRILTGREYAEEYLLPLAKTDLLFDDIHFLSPVTDVCRLRTFRDDPVGWQERCNDEFRITVRGKHRGIWTARADCVIDCRGTANTPDGLGPGGGHALGEDECEGDFYPHSPEDRKWDRKKVVGKKLVLVGHTPEACLAAEEWIKHFPEDSGSRLIWIVRPQGSHESESLSATIAAIEKASHNHVVILRALGVDSIARLEPSGFRLRLLKDDDSSVELEADVVLRRTGHHYRSIAPQLLVHAAGPIGACDRSSPPPAKAEPREGDSALPATCTVSLPDGADTRFITAEPGYYVLNANSMEEGAGSGIPRALQSIKHLYAVLGGRQDLDLYEILEKQLANP